MEQVKVNAIIPLGTREQLREMAVFYKTTIQSMVMVMIHGGMKSMTMKSIRSELAASAKKSPTRKYQRTKPI